MEPTPLAGVRKVSPDPTSSIDTDKLWTMIAHPFGDFVKDRTGLKGSGDKEANLKFGILSSPTQPSSTENDRRVPQLSPEFLQREDLFPAGNREPSVFPVLHEAIEDSHPNPFGSVSFPFDGLALPSCEFSGNSSVLDQVLEGNSDEITITRPPWLCSTKTKLAEGKTETPHLFVSKFSEKLSLLEAEFNSSGFILTDEVIDRVFTLGIGLSNCKLKWRSAANLIDILFVKHDEEFTRSVKERYQLAEQEYRRSRLLKKRIWTRISRFEKHEKLKAKSTLKKHHCKGVREFDVLEDLARLGKSKKQFSEAAKMLTLLDKLIVIVESLDIEGTDILSEVLDSYQLHFKSVLGIAKSKRYIIEARARRDKKTSK